MSITAILFLAATCVAGLDHAAPEQRARLLSDNGPCYVASDVSDGLESQGMRHTRGKPSHHAGQDRALAPLIQEPDRSRTTIRPAISNAPSPTSSGTTITGAMRAVSSDDRTLIIRLNQYALSASSLARCARRAFSDFRHMWNSSANVMPPISCTR